MTGTNGQKPEDHIIRQHVTGKIGPRNPLPANEPKKGFFARIFGCGLLLLFALGSAVLSIAGLVDIFGGAA